MKNLTFQSAVLLLGLRHGRWFRTPQLHFLGEWQQSYCDDMRFYWEHWLAYLYLGPM